MNVGFNGSEKSGFAVRMLLNFYCNGRKVEI